MLKHDRSRDRGPDQPAISTSTARSTPTSTASTPPIPRMVPEARKIDAISYDEMLELASVGAGVMHSRSHRIRQEVRRAAAGAQLASRDVEGTWIVPEADWMRDVAVCGAAIAQRRSARVISKACPTSRASAIASSRRSPSKNIARRHDRPERRAATAGPPSASRCCATI